MPLDETSSLDLVYVLRRHDVAPVEWPEAETTLIVRGEKMLPPPPGSRIAARIEDPFRREYETLELRPPGSVTVRLPPGVWRVVPMLPDADDDVVRCPNGTQQVVLSSGDKQLIALLAAGDAEGRCARG